MAQKRSGNTIHGDAKKPKQGDDYVLSKEENKLFSLERWYQPKSLRRNTRPEDMAYLKDMYMGALYFIRQAYCSIRATTSIEDDIFNLLKDKAAMYALIGLATLFRRMRRFSLCMRAIRTDLCTKLKLPSEKLDTSGQGKCPMCSLIHAQGSLIPNGELVRSGNGERSVVHERGGDQFSIKIYHMLLILDEMLALMGIESGDAEGETRYGDAKLAGMVERRMSLLRTEMEQEETSVIQLINSESESECVSACNRLRNNVVIFFGCDVRACKETVLSANKEIHQSLQKVIEFIDDIELNWHSSTTIGRRPKPHQQRLYNKLIQHKLDLDSKRIFAALGIE